MQNNEEYAIWHPFTQMKTAGQPVNVVRGEGTKLYTDDGRVLIDAVASWWVNLYGHAHPEIGAAIAKQATTLEQVIFSGFTHPQAIQLSHSLLRILPGNPGKIFFSDDGSTAVEVALKMAVQYFFNRGEKRTRILAFENAYHGDTFGAMSVSGHSPFTAAFHDQLFGVDFIPVPDQNNMENVVKKINLLLEENNYAAFIFEPLIQGSGGMIMYDAALLSELIRICRKKNIIIIADEIFTGFGRTGKLFACDYLPDEQPDIVCISKGLTGGFLPMGITACRDFVYDAFYSDDRYKTLFHGHSYTANPLACAAANASFDILMRKETQQKIRHISERNRAFVEEISRDQRFIHARSLGTIMALEVKTEEGMSYFSNIRDRIYDYFIKKGLLMRPLGNVIYIVPPYCITDEELDAVYQAIRDFNL